VCWKPSSLMQCKKFQKVKFLGILGHYWINVIIFTFIIEKNRHFRCLYKISKKIISFWHKKKGKSKIGHKKNEEKNEFESLGVSS